MPLPMISIITSAYNAERTVARTIHSVLAQSYENFEYIIVNHGSTDKTGEILRDFADQDDRIHMIEIQENTGSIGKALNVALSLAKGRYVCFLDADDWFEPDFLHMHFHAIQKYSVDVVISGYKLVDEYNNYLSHFLPDTNVVLQSDEDWINFNKSFFVSHAHLSFFDFWWNKLYCLEFLQTNGIQFSEIKDVFSDSQFNYAVFKQRPKTAIISYIGINYLKHGNARTYKYYYGDYLSRIAYVKRWNDFLQISTLKYNKNAFNFQNFVLAFYTLSMSNEPLEGMLDELFEWCTHTYVLDYIHANSQSCKPMRELELAIEILSDKYKRQAKDEPNRISAYYNIVNRRGYTQEDFDSVFEMVFQEDNPCSLGVHWIIDYLLC